MSSPPWQAPESGSTSTFPRLWASHPTHPVRRAARQSESPARAGTHCGRNTASTIPLAPMFIPLASPICKHFGCIIAQILTEYQREIHIRGANPDQLAGWYEFARAGSQGQPLLPVQSGGRTPLWICVIKTWKIRPSAPSLYAHASGEAPSKPRRTQRSGHCQG